MADDEVLDKPAPQEEIAEGSEQQPPEGKSEVSDVAALKAEFEKLQKSYKEIQGFDTKVSQENAKLKAKLELLESQTQRGVDPAVAEREQRDFDEKWRKDLAEDPGKAVDFFRGTARELRDSVKELVLNEVKNLIGSETRKVREDLDPAYQAQRQEVDRLMEQYEIPRAVALKLVQNELKPNGVSQPGRPQIPSKTGGKGGVGREEIPEAPPDLDGHGKELMRMLGLDEAGIKEIMKDLAKGAK